MLITVDTRKPLDQIREDLPRACAAHQFGVLGVHDLGQKLREKGAAYGGECLVFDVCNPQKAREALEAIPEIATALPCRIAAYRTRDGRTRLSTIRPTLLLGMFGEAGLGSLAAEVEAILHAIMEEAAREPRHS